MASNPHGSKARDGRDTLKPGGKEERGTKMRREIRTQAEQSEIVKRALAMLHSKPEPTPTLPSEGRTVEALEVHESETIQAVKIASRILNDDIWLILDYSFTPTDGLACYYAEEIPLLKGKNLEDLKEIHKAKLAFGGCRIIQDGPERKERTHG